MADDSQTGAAAATALGRLERTDLAEQTYRFLRHRIVTCQIKAGEKVSVDDVAAQLGISRTPVIEALQRLERDRLVQIIPQRGTFVTRLTERSATELFDVRLMMELYAVDQVLALGRAAEFVAKAQQPLANMAAAVSEGKSRDYVAFIEADQAFHLALMTCAGNEHLVDMYSSLKVHIDVARAHFIDSLERAHGACREHQAILDAFSLGDRDLTRQALSSHIENGKMRVLEIAREHGGSL